MLIVDVGANIGAFSNHILGLGLEADVVAIEPNPMCIERLERLRSQNKRRFDFIVAALTDEDGEVELYGSSIFGGQVASTNKINPDYEGNHFLKEEIAKSPLTPILVKGISVIEFTSYIGNRSIDFLKIDVQGNDVRLLKNLLEEVECKSGVIEVTVSNLNQSSEDLTDLCWVLNEKGFQILRIVPAEATCREYNVFFGHRAHPDPIGMLRLDECEVFSRFWNLSTIRRQEIWRLRVLRLVKKTIRFCKIK